MISANITRNKAPLMKSLNMNGYKVSYANILSDALIKIIRKFDNECEQAYTFEKLEALTNKYVKLMCDEYRKITDDKVTLSVSFDCDRRDFGPELKQKAHEVITQISFDILTLYIVDMEE